MGEKIVPKNLLEDIIDYKLDEMMETANICKCDYCRADVWAYALNNMEPKYVVSLEGDVHTRYAILSDQIKSDVAFAIVKAIGIVANNPHHHA